jgi:formate hydrogenlyase subunit 6/NADH:ubiquinone oxidoreductase subunit I
MILAWVNDIREGVRSFLTGMRTTGRFLVENLRNEGGATAVTRQYPQMPAEVIGNRQRGHLYNKADICIVCHACDKVCPVDCFKMEMERNEDNKPHCSRFDIDLSKCIYCGLCVRACPTDSLSMTATFELDPTREGARFLYTRNNSQLDIHLDEPEMARLRELSQRPREDLNDEERAFVDRLVDPNGHHLIGIYGLGYYTPEEKARVDAERDARKKAKDAAAAAAKAKAAAAAAAAAPAGDKPAAAAKPATPATKTEPAAEPPAPTPRAGGQPG